MAWLRTAVLLGAGTGSRLKSVIDDRPKGFVQFGKYPIVQESIGKLVRLGIQRIIIVAGYKKEFYEDLAGRFPFVQVVTNRDFETTGSMDSLLCARNRLRQDDFLLLEADLIYEMRGLLALQNSEHRNSILVSGWTGSGDEVYVGTDGNRVVKLSKEIETIAVCRGELVGLSRISFPLFQQMIGNCEGQENHRRYDYEDCLTDVSSGSEIGYDLLDDLAWIEVDTPEHFEKAERRMYPLVQQRDRQLRIDKRVSRTILLNPGPATTTESVKFATVVEDLCPREEEFGALVEEVRKDLAAVVHGEETHEAVLFAGSGTGAVEACLSSVIPPHKKVLILNNGAYGRRMQEICDGFSIPHIDYDLSWGQPIDRGVLDSLLKRHCHELSHVAVVHHETTTGMLNPLDDISALAHAYGLELIVDAMSSFAGIPIDLGRSKVEYLISSSNKCLQGMAGISFVICRRTSLEGTESFPIRNYYFNLYRNYFFFKTFRQMQFTPPVQILFALRQAINEYFLEGEQTRFERYSMLYEILREGMRDLGLRLLIEDEHQSGILMAILEPENLAYNFRGLHDFLLDRGFTIYPGKGGKQNTFRLSIMGALTEKDIHAFLNYLREFF